MNDEQQKEHQVAWLDTRDVLLVIGLGLIGYGAWLVYQPAGFIAPGSVLAGVAVFGVRN